MRLIVLSVAVAVALCACGADARPSLDKLLKGKDPGSIWALLVAGSNTWMNYRHQADVCHAYQIFHAHGVPDDHIVVMMYDDIANNEQNPNPGVVINQLKGPNVYSGVLKDYTKEEVTPENFLSVMQGNTAEMSGIGSGKVIASGPDDYVFVNFVDHGGVGIIAFPDELLSSKKLNEAIQNMADQNKFKQLVFYLEACESGSMFENLLPDNINVYAVTAANARESSYACIYDSKLETYLGDCFSVNWMENVDQVGTTTETLEQQYTIVKKETTTSHVKQYGDLDIDDEYLSVFMGNGSGVLTATPIKDASRGAADAVPVGDVPIAVLMHKVHDTTDYWTKRKYEQQLLEELLVREKVRTTMEDIVHVAMGGKSGERDAILTEKKQPTDFDCYMAALGSFSKDCFKFSEVEYALRHVHVLANLCNVGVPIARILEAIDMTC